MAGRHGGDQGGRPPVHGMSKHPMYAVWASMHARCYRKSHYAFKDYGARGINVCAAWYNFETFFHDMWPTYKTGLTLERIDNALGYSKENCEWASWKVQARNRRNNRYVDTPIGLMSLSEAAEYSSLLAATIKYRVDVGWPASRLFDPPNRGRHRYEPQTT